MSSRKKDDNIKKAKISNFLTIFKYLRPYMGVYLIGWIFLVLSSLAGLFFPYLLGKLLGSSNSSLSQEESFSLLSPAIYIRSKVLVPPTPLVSVPLKVPLLL